MNVNGTAESNRNQDSSLMTLPEVARIMTERGYPMSAGAAWHAERRALRKISLDPIIREIADDLGFTNGLSKDAV